MPTLRLNEHVIKINREIAEINTDYPTLCVCKIRIFF